MSRRLLKAGEAIREVVSMAILTEMRDPRVQNVTVIGVDVAPDMRTAKVNVSIMGSEKNQELVLRGLQHAAGFLQSKIADRIETRYTPKLTFVMDKGVKHSLEVQRILNEVLPKNADLESDVDASDDVENDDLHGVHHCENESDGIDPDIESILENDESDEESDSDGINDKPK